MGLPLSPAEGCSLKTLTQVCTVRLHRYRRITRLAKYKQEDEQVDPRYYMSRDACFRP